MDMPTLLAAAGLKNFSGSVNLVFDTQGQSGLLMAAGSVDKKNTYVFEVAPRSVVKSAGKSLSYWSTGNGDDTMVTIWNPANEAQTFIFRLIFAGGHYDDPMTLGPRATTMFAISDIIRTAGTDPEGNIIPVGTQEGSVKIIGLEAENQSLLLSVDSGIYNVRRATCYQNCPTCDGATEFLVSLDPFGLAVNGETQESFVAQWNTGAQYDYTSSGSWSSSNTSIATVPQPGLVQGVATGNLTVSASISDVSLYAVDYCAPPGCPLYAGGSGSSPGTVGKEVTLISTDCFHPGSAGDTPYYAGWADPKNISGCAMSVEIEDFPATPAGSCILQSSGGGISKNCWQTNVNGCVTTTCASDTRIMNQDCTQFLDSTPSTVVKVGCNN